MEAVEISPAAEPVAVTEVAAAVPEDPKEAKVLSSTIVAFLINVLLAVPKGILLLLIFSFFQLSFDNVQHIIGPTDNAVHTV